MMRRCTRCQVALDDPARFCPRCGLERTAAPAATTLPSALRRAGTLFLAFAAVPFVLYTGAHRTRDGRYHFSPSEVAQIHCTFDFSGSCIGAAIHNDTPHLARRVDVRFHFDPPPGQPPSAAHDLTYEFIGQVPSHADAKLYANCTLNPASYGQTWHAEVIGASG